MGTDQRIKGELMMEALPKDSEIAALLPEYTAHGDSTRLILRDGREIVVNCTARTALRYLAERSCKSLGLMRAWAARYTRRRSANPVPIDCDLVLVPVKTREPRVAGDNTLGQVNVALSPRLVEAPERRIEFPGGGRVPVLWSEKTVSAHLAEGRHIHADLIRSQEESVLRRLTMEDRAKAHKGTVEKAHRKSG